MTDKRIYLQTELMHKPDAWFRHKDLKKMSMHKIRKLIIKNHIFKLYSLYLKDLIFIFVEE